MEALGRLDCIMGGVSQSTYPTFPSARSAPAGPSSSNGDSFTGSIIRNAVPGMASYEESGVCEVYSLMKFPGGNLQFLRFYSSSHGFNQLIGNVLGDPGLPHSASQQSLAFSAIPEVNSRSVLVSNLDPKTTPEQLQEVFQVRTEVTQTADSSSHP